jgi:hypothetical protein
MRFVIPFIVAFLLSFTLSGQEYKKVYTEMTEDKFEQILEEENLSYGERDYGYIFKYESDNRQLFGIGIVVKTDYIVFYTKYTEEVEIPSYILNQWNQKHPEMLAHNNEELNKLIIKSTVKCTGGVTASHIAYRLRLFGEKFTDFNDKYVK